MKKMIYLILLSQAVICAKGVSQDTLNAEITYIGNEGFMISNNNKKIFIDALYRNESTIQNVDEAVRNKIITNKAPFSNSQLYLSTHNHGDHFDATYVSRYLEYNPQACLIAPRYTAPQSEQLIEVYPDKYEYEDTIVNGIDITAYNLLHISSISAYNVGYYANLDGFKIFHCADNLMEDTTEYVNIKLNEKDIDVAFFTSYAFWVDARQRDFVKRHINPKYIVLMHIFNNEVVSTKYRAEVMNENQEFIPIVVFSESMEKIRITDTLEFINQMPERITTLQDTTFLINEPIDIHLPEIFKDPDENDTLIYSASGLPEGLNFNASSMHISGAIDEAGSYRIKIIATDTSQCAANTSFRITVGDPAKIADRDQRSAVVYPNPANNILYIDLNDFPDRKGTISIFNHMGGLVLVQPMNDTTSVTVDLDALPEGVYYLQADIQGEILHEKIVVTR